MHGDSKIDLTFAHHRCTGRLPPAAGASNLQVMPENCGLLEFP